MFTRSPVPVNPEQELSSPTRLCPPELTVPLQSGPFEAVFPDRMVLEGEVEESMFRTLRHVAVGRPPNARRSR